MPMDRGRYAERLIRQAHDRRERGLSIYGEFNPVTDIRILSTEALEESIDIENYLYFLERKHPELFQKIKTVRRLNFDLFCHLMELEAAEVSTRKKGGVV